MNRRLGGPRDGLDVWRRDVSCPYRDSRTKSSIMWPIQDTEFPNIHKPNLCPMLKISKHLDQVQVPHNWRFMMKIRHVTFSKNTKKLLRYGVHKTTFRKSLYVATQGAQLHVIHLLQFISSSFTNSCSVRYKYYAHSQEIVDTLS